MAPRLILVGLLAVVTTTCSGCDRPQERSVSGQPLQDRGGAQAQVARRPADVVRFRPYRCVDSEGLGIAAFGMLVPVGWQVDGGVSWRLDNPAFPAYGALRISNPARLEEVEIFPNLPMFWTNNQMVLGMFPVGAKYFGNVVHPPLGARDALRQLVLPAYRGNVTGLAIIGEAPVPELAAAVQQMQARMQPEAGIRADAAKVRIEYSWNGTTVEEELYGVVQAFSFTMPTMQGTVTNQNWWVDYLFSFKAAKGRLDEAAKLLQTVAFSFRVEPQWFAGCGRVVEALIKGQIQQIRHIGEIGRIYAQTGSEIREAELHRWEADQAVRDRLADDWSRQFRGYDRYWDPAGERMVELPSGYDNAWVNNLGEVVLAADPSFNPNIGSNQTWTPMPKK